MFAVDAGSTQAVGQIVAKYGLKKKGIKAGGYDLHADHLEMIQTGQLDFTIDQQPYLQGWLPVLQLFFYKYSSGGSSLRPTRTRASSSSRRRM